MIKRNKSWQPIVKWIWIVLCIVGCHREDQKADLILRNGRLFTARTLNHQVQAVAIQDDRILAAGNNEEMKRFLGTNTQVIDLQGKFGCPGFNDSHIHLFEGGKSMLEMDLSGLTTIEEIQKRVLKKAWTLKPGDWLIGRGWDQNLMPGGEWPTKRYLDVIAPDVPAYFQRVCSHAVWVNSKALSIAGITNDTPNPPGGEIVRDSETGEPTGILKDEAMKLVSQYIPAFSEEWMQTIVLIGLEAVRKVGVTSVQDCSTQDVYPYYEKLLEEGNLTCRISMWLPLKENLRYCKKFTQKYGGAMLRFGLLKGNVDGSMDVHTAMFLEPYTDDPTSRGTPQLTDEELNGLVLSADREGFQIGIHAVGDSANRMVLNAFELARRINGKRDSRHRIEHAQIVSKKDMVRFDTLGVVVSVQPFQCSDDMDWVEGRIGSRRCRYAYAWRSLKNKKTKLAFGSNWPAEPLNPVLGIYAAVTRKDTLGYPAEGWFPQERLSVEEAIQAYTLGSAYAEFMETEKGSLETGKLADIVLFDRDLRNIPSEDILKSKVVCTILGGKIVYQSDTFK